MVKASAQQKHLFYMEMAKLLGAGFDIRRAGRVLSHTKLPAAQARLLEDLHAGLESGESIADSFARDRRSISGLERSMISAGERGGKLAPAFQHLADYFGMIAAVRREIIKGLIYPMIVLHLGIAIGNIPLSITGDPLSLEQVAGGFLKSLFMLYATVAIVFFVGKFVLGKSSHSPVLDRAIGLIPWLGAARRSIAMARFCKVYHACLLAGISMVETVRVSAESAQSGLIHRAGGRIAGAAAQGHPLGPEFLKESAFPAEFSRSYATGEEAGTLDTDMGNWSRRFQESAESTMKLAGIMIPKLLYFGIMAYVAWKVVSFFTGYYSALDTIG